jgi:hypothetical protein
VPFPRAAHVAEAQGIADVVCSQNNQPVHRCHFVSGSVRRVDCRYIWLAALAIAEPRSYLKHARRGGATPFSSQLIN